MSDFVEYDDYQHRSDIEQHDEQDPGMIFIPQGSVYAELDAERALTDGLAALVDEMAEYAEHRHHDRIMAVLARYREARQ